MDEFAQRFQDGVDVDSTLVWNGRVKAAVNTESSGATSPFKRGLSTRLMSPH